VPDAREIDDGRATRGIKLSLDVEFYDAADRLEIVKYIAVHRDNEASDDLVT
jgi:hypothetical protein